MLPWLSGIHKELFSLDLIAAMAYSNRPVRKGPDVMHADADFSAKARDLIRFGKFCYKRGWVPATSGNFSVRLASGQVAITVSGQHKGKLNKDGIMVVDLQGTPLTAGRKPSAETLLHTALYRRDATINAVLHTHSVNATVLSLLHREALRLTDYEVLKAFPGIDTHEGQVSVPIFSNDQDMGRLAATVDRYLDKQPGLHGYLIAGHGFYAWGASMAEASRHIEAFEFLFDCEVLLRRLGKP
jgi:methylthioribulose-1-phosphate dehydratase